MAIELSPAMFKIKEKEKSDWQEAPSIVQQEIKPDLMIDTGIILSEDQTSYIIHNYKEVSYVKGQRAVYGEIPTNIVINGFLAMNSSTTKNMAGTTLEEVFPDGVPEMLSSFDLYSFDSGSN